MRKTCKKALSLFLVLVLVLGILPGSAFATEKYRNSVQQFSGGDGTANNPYQISTAEQFDNIRNDLSASYVLQNDISFTNFASWTPIETFSGVLDGQGHIITGFSINNSFEFDTSKTYCGLGLFGTVSNGGVIKNLELKDVNITTDSGKLGCCGALVGKLFNGTINNCHVSGKMMKLGNGGYTGGLVGYADHESATIIDCHNYCDITVTGQLEEEWGIYAGGIVGYSLSSNKIEHCYNSGNVEVQIDWVLSGTSATVVQSGVGGITGLGRAKNSCNVATSLQLKNSSGVALYERYCNRISGGYESTNCVSLRTTKVDGSVISSGTLNNSDGQDMDTIQDVDSWYNNITKPDQPTPPIPEDVSILVYFLSGWDAVTRTVKFGDEEITPDTYTVADNVDVSNISSLLNKYVLVTMEQGDSSLEYTITDIQPVESKIGTVSATGEHSLTIDGTTYPVREDYVLASYDGEEVLYHVSNGTIMGFYVLEEKTGTLEAWDSTTGKVTIDGKVYSTNYMSDLSFVSDIGDRLNKQYYFRIAKTGDYTMLYKIAERCYPGGKLEDFNADIYHATWLSKHGNAADMLGDKTPSEILIDVVSEGHGDLAMDMWRSLNLVFETLDDVDSLREFAVKPRDLYSALILDALEASVSIDVVASEYEDALGKFRRCLSDFSTFVKKDKGIDLNNSDEFQDIVSRMPGVDVDAYTEKFISNWYKTNCPNITDISKSLGYLSKGLKAVGTLENFAEYCAECVTLMRVSDSMKYVLERACLKSAEIYGPTANMTQAFNDCLQMITSSSDELFDQIETKAVSVVGLAGYKYLVSEVLWAKVSQQVQVACPEIAILKLIYKAENTICNKLFKTEDAAEKYLKMDGIVNIESIMNAVYRDLEFAFDRTPTQEGAKRYLSAMELSFRLRDVDCKTSNEYVENIQSSLVGSIKELLGAADYESLKQCINSIQSEYASHYTLAETGWVPYLEEDYPSSGLYELYSALYELMEGEKGGFRHVKEITAACPVNVYVYDQRDNVVASVIDGRVSCSVDDAMIALVGDEKIIRLYSGADYRIEYLGYDTGDMDVTITEFDESEKTTRTVNYYNLALTDGKTYTMDATDEVLKPYDLVDKSDNAAVQHDYDSMDTNHAHTVKIVSGTMQQGGELFTEATASKGETLQLDAYVPEGYKFVHWNTTSENTVIANTLALSTTMIMPDEDITVTAVIEKTSSGGSTGGDTSTGGSPSSGNSSTSYSITAGSFAHGSVSISPKSASKGTTVTVTATPDTGYRLEKLTIIDSKGSKLEISDKGDGKYTFTMPVGTVKVEAVFVLDETPWINPFADVAEGAWYYNAVRFVSENNLMGGYGNDVFGVNDNLSRAQFAQVFFNKEGKPTVTDSSSFTDVLTGQWYTPAVIWANKQGVVGGYGNGLFGPNDDITREQLAVMLWRYAGKPAPSGTTLNFTDANKVSSWALDAMRWATENGIVNGKGNGILDPKGFATRAEVAQMLKNCLDR